MHFSLNMVPVPQWTHRRFEAADPWSGNQPTQWSIVVYKMLSETFADKQPRDSQSVAGDSNEIPAHLAVGIAAPDGNYRILPLALQGLWRTGKVPDREPPRLLHRTENELKMSDYPPDRGSCLGLALGSFSILVFLASFIVSLFAPSADRIIAFQNTGEWLAAPIAGPRQVAMHQPVTPAAVTPVSPPLAPPAGIKNDGYHPAERNLLAVIPAGQEHRLALISAARDLDNPAGAVLSRSSLALPDPALVPLKERFPNLNTAYVLCVGWNRTDAVSPFDIELFTTARQFMVFLGPFALICFSPVAWRQLRRRSVARKFLRLLDSPGHA